MNAPLKKYRLLLGIVFTLLLSFNHVNAQQASGIPFLFSATTPSVAAVTATNIILTTRTAAVQDEWDTLIAPGGFNFNFAGVNYTNFIVSSNGWMALTNSPGPAVPASIPTPLPNNSLSTYTGGLPIVAPLWDDLTCGIVQWGVAANVLTIKWSVKWDKTNAAAYAALMWVTLNGANGVITMQYSIPAYVPTIPSASMGIAGVCTGDFYSVTPNAVVTSSTIDSVTENAAVNLKPVNAKFTFTPNCAYDNCVAPKFIGNITSTCTNTLVSTFNATASGVGNCATADVKDVWFSYLKPAGMTTVIFKTAPPPGPCGSVNGTSMEVYNVCGGASLGCATTSVANPNYAEVTVTRSACVAETLYVRVTSDADLPGKFQICAQDLSVPTGSTCANPTPICFPLPYNTSGTTLGSGNDYGDSILCQSAWMTGEDYLYDYYSPVTQCVCISIDGAGILTFPGLFVLDGCPNDTGDQFHLPLPIPGSHCVASATNTSNGDTICGLVLSANHHYYIVIDNDSIAAAAHARNIPYNLHITPSPLAAPPNDGCATAPNLGTVIVSTTCTWSTTYTTECATPSANTPFPSCGSFSSGFTNDVWLSFTAGPAYSGVVLINSQGGATNPVINGGMALYSGNCGALTLLGCAGDSVAIAYMPSLSINVVAGQTYYIRFWSATGFDPGTFQLCFTANCSPPNDLPVNAQLLTIGVPALGDNTCSTNASEPPLTNPVSCTSAPVNTVWYKLVVPPSGQVAVRVSQLSLTDAALAAYTLPSWPLTTPNTQLACNDDIIFASPCPICGMTGDNDAAIQFSALPGSTVYIVVDGEGPAVGSFYITAIEGTLASTFPPVYRKDCANPEFICNNTNYVLPNGGVGSDGNICDFQNLACGATSTSEVGSAWLQFTVTPGSQLGFTITPNDSAAPIANYNFYMWDITGIANICTQLSITAPIRCNTFASTGKTGCRNPITSVYADIVPAYAVPHTYMLYVQNLTSGNDDEGVPGTNIGFVINWDIFNGGINVGSTQITGSSPSCSWIGTVVDTDYQNIANWKGVGTCPPTLPTCTTDVYISAATKQCWVTGNSYARNVTINPGGILSIRTGGTLHVCGDFINNGSLIAQPGSTVIFEGSVTQNISGALTGANSFANLTVNKLNTTRVMLNNNADVTQNFTTSNPTSVFNINGRYLKVDSDFTNSTGNTTFVDSLGSTVDFNGITSGHFTNQNGSLNLNRVTMNKTGKLYLNGVNSILNVDSVLTLTNGYIVTTPTLETNVKWANLGAIVGYSPNSYIDGRLRRKLINLNSNDFPVGDSAVPNAGAGKGYELANITFTSSTIVPDLLCSFNIWLGATPVGPVGPDYCAMVPVGNSYTTSYNNSPIYDNGYWSFVRSSPAFNGAYNVTLYNTGGTNTAGGPEWTVATAALAAAPLNPASWFLSGTCFNPSTLAITKRVLFNSPVLAGGLSSFNQLYATAQTNSILPIELLYFTADPDGEQVLCKWETASEINNDYFDVERSTDGSKFEFVGKVQGFGQGTSAENRSYSLLDDELCHDIVYYRLKQVDIDGHYTYSNVVAVNCNLAKSGISIHPNPASSSMMLTFTEPSDGNVIIDFIDYTGRVVLTKNSPSKKGFNNLQLSVEELSKGVYYLNIHSPKQNSEVSRQIRFIKN